MKVSISFYLANKWVMLSDGSHVDVYGLSEMRVYPESAGIGKMMLSVMVQLADDAGKFAVVGFANESVAGFYKKCGWYVGDSYLCPVGMVQKRIVSSKQLPPNIVINVIRMW